MKTLLIVAIAFLCGCTRIAVNEPIGKPVSAQDNATLEGNWSGPKGEIYTVSRAAGGIAIAYEENKKHVERHALLTVIEPEITILWVRDDAIRGFIPFRVSSFGEGVSLLYPDEEEIRRLTDQGVLVGKYNETERSWLLEHQGLENELKGKRLWRLDYIIPIHKKQ